MTMSSEQLEREAERSRERLSSTLEELRSRITPGQVMDQLIDYARESGGGEFVQNLGSQVRQNPLPLALVGAGMAWLMFGRGPAHTPTSGQSHDSSDAHAYPSRTSGDIGKSATQAGSAVRESLRTSSDDLSARAAETSRDLGEKASAARSALGNVVSDAKDRTSDAVQQASSAASTLVDEGTSKLTGSAQTFADSAGAIGRNFAEFCTQQPLFLAGLGIALGAGIGAAFAPTETESRLMGKASADLKERVQEVASDAVDKAATVASGAYEGAVEEVKKQQANDASTDLPTAKGADVGLVPTEQEAADSPGRQ
jgi:hypothetical protein